MQHPTTKGRKFPPEPLTRGEVMALIEANGRRSPTGLRNRALLWTLYRTGVRITEALDLQVKDLEPPKLRVLCGKGRKPRTVAMPPDAWAAVELWLARRRELGVPKGAPVFCTLRGGYLGHGYIRQMLERLRARAGLEKRIHAHGFRHTFASELVEEGQPLPLVSKALGHSHLETTARYLGRIGAEPRMLAALADRGLRLEERSGSAHALE
jgi:site-specific recombinase XerD